MRPLFNIKHLALLTWGLVNASLIVAIGVEWKRDDSLLHPVPRFTPAPPIEITPFPEFRLPPRGKAFAVALERPLFVPSRRKPPPVPPPPPPPPPTMQKGQFQLVGTLITDDMKAAMVREISSGKERQVVEGFTINGLQLERVEPDRIVFTQYGDHEEIPLKLQRSPKPAAKPVLAVPGQPAQPGAALPAQGAAPPAAWTPRGITAAPSRPAPEPSKPMTMEDRRKNPMLKDFYK